MPWNPSTYLNFADLRLRPALDLIAHMPRVHRDRPLSVVDLGCGTGSVIPHLLQTFEGAAVIGVDNSQAMLEKARAEMPQHAWLLSDIETWLDAAESAQQRFDVLFANASLHWLDDHASLFPRLMQRLSPGGVLAVQMPNNYAAASHQVLFELAQQPEWAEKIGHIVRPSPILSPAQYAALLGGCAQHVDIWETEYLQLLSGVNPVADWVRGSLLVPVLEALSTEDGRVLEAEYRARILGAYGCLDDGRVVFPFKRFFLVAVGV